MAASQLGESSHQGMTRSSHNSHEVSDEENFGSRWYFSRKEIEENSPSRRDGIDLKKETYLRKSYCTFLQDLGMRLKVPQVTIATAIVFCHRFFLRQSHAKNDRRTIATVCMFLAGKVEETPRPLKDVILVSYEVIHKKDPSAVQRIKQKEVYEEQKELILLGERLVLVTLGFDFNVHHPYKPLVEAIKRFKVAQHALAQVAWNFVNDGLRTSLCLQYKPHHIAAGAIFLAAKFLKVKLPSDGEVVWWQEFDVTPRQLEDVSNQMLELYEQNKTVQSSHASEAEGNMGCGSNQPAIATSIVSENSLSISGPTQNARANKQGGQTLSCELQVRDNNKSIQLDSAQKQSVGSGTPDDRSGVWDQTVDSDSKDCVPYELENISDVRQNAIETSVSSKSTIEQHSIDAVVIGGGKLSEAERSKDEASLIKPFTSSSQTNYNAAGKRSLPSDVIAKIDKNKVKAALEKRRKIGIVIAKDMNIIDDHDLMERELEDGIESSVNNEKVMQPRVHEWSKHQNTHEPAGQQFEQNCREDIKNIKVSDQQLSKPKTRSKMTDPEFNISSSHELENVEEGELSSLDDQYVPCTEAHSDGKDTSTVGSSLEVSGAGVAGSKRNWNDYDSSCKLVGEQAMGIGRQLENVKQHDVLNRSYDTAMTGQPDYIERDHKRSKI